MQTIYIQNKSTVVTDDALGPVVEAINVQIDKHFCPYWGLDAIVEIGEPKTLLDWQILLLDDSDQAGALGYHDLTNSESPISRVFVKDDLKYGLQWSVTLSHEVLEMIADPYINLVVMKDWNTLYSYEVCDACEDDQFAYKIGDVLVSDFVKPAWFDPHANLTDSNFDYCGKIKTPFELLSGGYIGEYNMLTRQWSQKVNGQKKPSAGHRSTMRQLKASMRDGQ